MTYEYFAFEIDSMTALLLDKNTWVNYGCIVIRNYPLGNALLTSVTFPGKRKDDHIGPVRWSETWLKTLFRLVCCERKTLFGWFDEQ